MVCFLLTISAFAANLYVASQELEKPVFVGIEDGYYTLTYGIEAWKYYTVTATELDGNRATVSGTITSGHIMTGWDSDGEYIWPCCSVCGAPSDEKYEKPEVHIVGDDTVCRSEQYQFTVSVPSNCEFSDCLGSIWQFTP